MRFPIREGDILLLAQAVAAGLAADEATFPIPPVASAALEADIDTLNSAYETLTAARAALDAAIEAKDALLATLADNVKKDLRYAENTTGFNDAKLKELGWSGRRARHKLTAPGQPHSLKCLYQDFDNRVLSWQEPGSGGKVAMYKILRRSLEGILPDGSNGTWHEVASSLVPTAPLLDQPAGRRLEFIVRAVNRAGEGVESNTVEITL